METEGNVMAQGQPVSGLTDPGPVLPRQPPSTLEQMTKYFSVSKALPGPIILAHQPSSPAACASPENAWSTRIALFFSGFSEPQVSYAASTPRSVTPQSSASSSKVQTEVSVTTILFSVR